MKPDKMEFHLGRNIFGQPIRLVQSRDSSNRPMWTICRDEADQRDDRSSVAGLTPEIIRLMAECVKQSTP